jgi:hypothetical protein
MWFICMWFIACGLFTCGLFASGFNQKFSAIYNSSTSLRIVSKLTLLDFVMRINLFNSNISSKRFLNMQFLFPATCRFLPLKSQCYLRCKEYINCAYYTYTVSAFPLIFRSSYLLTLELSWRISTSINFVQKTSFAACKSGLSYITYYWHSQELSMWKLSIWRRTQISLRYKTSCIFL